MKENKTLRIHRLLPLSRANGPGTRSVIWMQGCTLGCPGCCNPGMQPLSGGKKVSPAGLFARILRHGNQIEGITLTGGEPLLQMEPLTDFLAIIKRCTKLSVIVFTGYTWEETLAKNNSAAFLALVDILIAGRYDQEKKTTGSFRSSSNQTIHFLDPRYSPKDLKDIPSSEILISEDGNAILTGTDPAIL